ncbi:hypothetical protein MHPYR_10341 [uncultured Mycobacterium sp.]|uniref:Uncharacterized protein n=1 Tax=uncultured Mycobacterium sp. TaxID=171292 RepID=A0A1Y5NWU0_9MYCO|nr:hypothetical protein MHPYR_10341 [uncultured Mycobacterium sp.]
MDTSFPFPAAAPPGTSARLFALFTSFIAKALWY